MLHEISIHQKSVDSEMFYVNRNCFGFLNNIIPRDGQFPFSFFSSAEIAAR